MRNQKEIPHKTQALYPLTAFSSNVQYFQRDVSSRQSRGKSKSMNFHKQTAFCKDHQVEDAKIEWVQFGYPRIAWRRLHLWLMKKSLALCNIINGSSSFFGTELEAAIDRKEAHKYRCMGNMIAGYKYYKKLQLLRKKRLVWVEKFFIKIRWWDSVNVKQFAW